MTSSTGEEHIKNIISALKRNPTYKDQLLEILGPEKFVRRDELNETLNEIKELRKDFNHRMEEQQTNFNERFEKQQANFNERFEKQQANFNERFEKQQANINEKFEKQDQKFEQLVYEMRKGFALIRSELAEFSTKYGYQREAEARKLLKEFLKSRDISVSKIKHHQIIDEEGLVFGKDYITEIDAYYEHEEGIWVFEFKAKADDRDVYHFNKVVELFEKAYKKDVSRKIITCFDITEKALEDCEMFDIEVWKEEKEDPVLIRPPDT